MSRSRSKSILVAVLSIGAIHCSDAPTTKSPPAERFEPVELPDVVVRSIGEAHDPNPIVQTLVEPDPLARVIALARLLPTLDASYVPDARIALREGAYHLGGAEMELLVRFWAQFEPDQATRWVISTPPHSFRPMLAVVAVEEWARVDPENAAAYVETLHVVEGPIVEATEVGLARGWYRGKRPGLQDYIRDRGAGFEQQRMLRFLAREIILNEGIDAAMAWAEAFDEEPRRLKKAAYHQLATELALADTDAAVAWYDRHGEGPHGLMMTRQIAARWGVSDPVACLEWLSTLPETAERDQGIITALSKWALDDPESMHAWFEARGPKGIDRWLNPAGVVYAGQIYKDRPEDGIEWAMITEKQGRREGTLVTIARHWLTVDKDAAEAWLATSPLPEDARERARSPGKPRRGAGRQSDANGASAQAPPLEAPSEPDDADDALDSEKAAAE